jgi:hypothetical protein
MSSNVAVRILFKGSLDWAIFDPDRLRQPKENAESRHVIARKPTIRATARTGG